MAQHQFARAERQDHRDDDVECTRGRSCGETCSARPRNQHEQRTERVKPYFGKRAGEIGFRVCQFLVGWTVRCEIAQGSADDIDGLAHATAFRRHLADHDTGAAMIADCEGQAETAAWLICDHVTIRRYGLGFAKPAPVPVGVCVRNGYLQAAPTLRGLAQKAGIDADGLEETVRQYNKGAVAGKDREFGRGSTAFNRFLGDPEHLPNPNVGPIGNGPYYALKLLMGDLGTFDGLTTDTVGRVLGRDSRAISGLYAVGNDRASIMGGNYPGAGITLGPIMTFGYITGRHLAGIEI